MVGSLDFHESENTSSIPIKIIWEEPLQFSYQRQKKKEKIVS